MDISTPINKSASVPSSVLHVLFALADAPRHGTAIMLEVEERTGGKVVLPAGTFYRTIKNMLRQGLIEDAPQAGADARRRCYRLTAAGLALARAEARRLSRTLKLVYSSSLLPSPSGGESE